MIAKIILVFLLTLFLGIGLGEHGKKRSRHDGLDTLNIYVIIMVLLYFSGFFDD
jgi:VIT1/CCC1 family predicted Fe2+/Mn2+ transporter